MEGLAVTCADSEVRTRQERTPSAVFRVNPIVKGSYAVTTDAAAHAVHVPTRRLASREGASRRVTRTAAMPFAA